MSAGTPRRPAPPLGSVAVVGLGVMGGSLVRALAALPERPRVTAHSASLREMEDARAAGVADVVTDRAEEAVSGADLVVYATPLGTVAEMLDEHRHAWASGAVVTDVASLKGPLVRRVRELGLQERYVGSHPMTGSEGSGWAASRVDLYAGAPVWVTSDTGSDVARATVEGLWTALGARPAVCRAEEHDRRMVWASHLPQLVANAVAAEIQRAGLDASELGPGGRDVTRLAGSSNEMWRDLLAESGVSAADALDAVIARMNTMSGQLAAGRVDDIARLMEQTRSWRGGAEDAG